MAASMDDDEVNMHGPIVAMPRPPSMIRPVIGNQMARGERISVPDVRVGGAHGVNVLAPIPDRFNILGPEAR
jgi:hypothetical protein